MTLLSPSAACGATGEVELVGTQIGSSGSNGGSGNTIAKAIDGDFTTFYDAANATGDWVGVDAGGAVTVTRWIFAARRGDSGITAEGQWENRLIAGKIQVSSTADFTSDVTDVDTVPATPFYGSYLWNQRTISGAPSKRYARYLGPTSSRCNLAELRIIVSAGPSDARPVRPTISPWGGNYTAGSATVTLASATTSASIYYTVDGSTPDATDTLYTAPFSLDCSPDVTLKAIAIDGTLTTTSSEVVSAEFRDHGYVPQENWFDTTTGNLVEAHNGHVVIAPGGAPLQVDGYYYWLGSNANHYNEITVFDGKSTDGVWLYRSTDLLNWQLIGNVIPNPLDTNHYVLRPRVIFNESTQKYVMWCHMFRVDQSVNGAGIATADDLEGPWTWEETNLNPDGLGYKDCTLFQDLDGTAYTVYTSGAQDGVFISQLASDYLSTTGSEVEILDGDNESPVMFRIDDTYHLITGDANYFNSDGASYSHVYQLSASPTSGWTTPRDLFSTDPLGGVYNGQPTLACVIGQRAFMGTDYWEGPTDLYDSRYVWLPLEEFCERVNPWDLSRLTVAENILLDDCVAAYPFDELTNTANAVDEVGGLTGTVTSNPTANGMVLRSRFCDTAKYFTVTDNAALDVGDNFWWFSVWVKRINTNSSGRIFVKDDGTAQRSYALFLDSGDGNKFTFGASTTGSGALTTVKATNFGNTTTNVWYHVIGAHDPVNNQLSIWVNNGTANTTAFSGGIFQGTANLKIGADNAGGSSPRSYIRNLMFWKRALPSTDERTALYNSGQGLQFEELAESNTGGLLKVLLESVQTDKKHKQPFYALAP